MKENTQAEVRETKWGWMARSTRGDLVGPVATREMLEKVLEIGVRLESVPRSAIRRHEKPTSKSIRLNGREAVAAAIAQREIMWHAIQ